MDVVKRLLRSVAFWVVLALVVLLVVGGHFRGHQERKDLRLSQFETRIAAGQVKTATFSDRDNEIKGELRNGDKYKVGYLAEDGTVSARSLQLQQEMQSFFRLLREDLGRRSGVSVRSILPTQYDIERASLFAYV